MLELSGDLRAANVCLGGRPSAAAVCDRVLWREAAFRSRSKTLRMALTCDIPRPGHRQLNDFSKSLN